MIKATKILEKRKKRKNMGILISIIVGIGSIALFIILNARNSKKMEELDDFAGEMKERKAFKENNNTDFLENEYKYQKKMNSYWQDIEYLKHIYFAKENIISGNFKEARKSQATYLNGIQIQKTVRCLKH